MRSSPLPVSLLVLLITQSGDVFAEDNAAASVAPLPSTGVAPPAQPSAAQTESKPYVEDDAALTLPKHIDAVALTVSGGVSLGAYEAGQVYLLTEALRLSPGAAKLVVTAGTSAGSANALIAGTNGCLAGAIAPQDSIGYKVWVPVGLAQLFNPKKVTQESLFQDKAVYEGFAEIEKIWKRGLPESCEFAFSVAATRAETYEVTLAEGLVVPRQAERFTVHVEGRGAAVPKFSNYLDRRSNFDRPLLPLSNGTDLTGAKDFAAIRSTILASGAFPIAFPAQHVPHCVSEPVPEGYDPKVFAEEVPTCARATRSDAFVDGGVFDNNPLGSSLRIATNGLYLDSAGKLSFRKVPTNGPEKKPEILHAFVDPDLTRYPLKRESGEKPKNDPLLALVGRLGAQVLTSMRGQELALQAESNRSALNRLWLIRSSSPPTSSLLGAFFGFFEKDFRDFDFYLGTYDTFVALRSKAGAAIGTAPYLEALERKFRGPPAAIEQRLHKLACIAAHHEPDTYGHLAPLCSGEDMRNFRVLLQVSLDRLWSNCRGQVLSKHEREQNVLCSRAQTGANGAAVDPTFKVKGERFQAENEGEFDYALRLFDAYQFEFKDLGLKRSEADGARLQIRRRLDQMVTALANAQPSLTDRTIVLTGGRTLVNSIAYEPPVHRVYVQVGGGLAAGYLGRLGDMSSFFWNPDVRVANLRGIWSDNAYSFNVTPSLGVEFLVLPLSSNVFQFSLGARAGFHFSAADNFATDPCDAVAANGDSRNCSQPVIHTPVNFSLLERVRLSATPYFYPMKESFDHHVADLEISIGAELF